MCFEDVIADGYFTLGEVVLPLFNALFCTAYLIPLGVSLHAIHIQSARAPEVRPSHISGTFSTPRYSNLSLSVWNPGITGSPDIQGHAPRIAPAFYLHSV